MRVFLTGGSGYIGGAVVRRMLSAGHHVTCLVRSDSAAAAVSDIGATALIGDLADPSMYISPLANHDVFIQTAYDYTVSTEVAAARDRRTIMAFAAAARSTPSKHVVYTSSIFVEGGTSDRPLTEDSEIDAATPGAARVVIERELLGIDDLSVSIIRPGMIYGGTGGTVGELFRLGCDEGMVPYVGDGENRWSMAHIDDVASLYALAVERRYRGVLHGVDGTYPTQREVVAAIARVTKAGTLSESISASRWRDYAPTIRRDVVADTPESKALGWQPGRPPFLSGAAETYAEWREGIRKTCAT